MLIFPSSIVKDDMNRPVIIFRNDVKGTQTDTHIVFPMPQALQFGDSASYNNSELNFTGAMLLTAGRSQTVEQAALNVAKQSMAAVPSDFASIANALGAAASKNSVQSAIGVATSTAFNKNIVSEFSGIGTRRFSFQFKLVMTTQPESVLVKKICDTFRAGLYPQGNSYQLRYPPTWYINFKKDGKDLAYIPKVFETYLESMTTSYNPSMTMFHADGSPVEIDLQLSFIESRALTKDDVVSLADTPFQDGDFTRITMMSKETNAATAAVQAAIDAVEKQTAASTPAQT